MTARVYLMALTHTGNGPQSAGIVRLPSDDICWSRITARRQDVLLGSECWSLTERQRQVLSTTRAWWLVEADSADAARKAIRLARARIDGVWDDPELTAFGPLGTIEYDLRRMGILASGGAK